MDSGFTILTIEDNPSDLFLLEHMLRDSGLDIRKFYSADRVREAYGLLNEHDINVVLLDLTLPDSLGINSFIYLKPVVQKIPVIILTGMSDTNVALEAIKEGAQDYLVKGELTESLLAKAIQYSIERKRTLEDLLASEEKYRQIFYKNPYPTWIFDLESLYIMEVNDAALEKYGFSKSEFCQLTVKDLHPPGEAELFLESIGSPALAKACDRILWRHKNRSGAPMTVEITSHRIEYFGKRCMQVIINDVTERVRLEKELALQQRLKQQQITEVVLGAQERERFELGQELHDNINQILATSKLYLDVAIEEQEPRIELLAKSRNNISMAIEEIRRLSKELITPSLNDLGLIQSIKELIRGIQVVGKIKIRLILSGFDENSLLPEQKINIYRIIQEQLNNILKHAQASVVVIELTKVKEQVRLRIRDDGKGFDPRTRRKGVGISNIISRAELYNGKVEIDSSPGKGCRLEVVLNSKAMPEQA
jgi:two-component system, NarL family, sensor histidine kinase UhpB